MNTIIIHGIFMQILDSGVLITGASGIGKGELALALIDRGHALIADDAPEFFIENDKIIGRSPTALQDYLEIRSLGIINIRKFFGNYSVVEKRPLTLNLNLTEKRLDAFDRLGNTLEYTKILGVRIPKISLAVNNKRRLELLIEIAIRNFQMNNEQLQPLKNVNHLQKRAQQ